MAESAKPVTPVRPPYLKHVRVRDYPPLRDARASFKPGLNIIIGNNGAGKTRFLTLVSSLADFYKEHFIGAGCELTIGGNEDLKTKFDAGTEAEDPLVNKPLILTLDVQSLHKTAKAASIFDATLEFPLNFFSGYLIVIVKHGVPTTGLPIVAESAELISEKRSFTVQLQSGSKRLPELQSRFVQAILRTIVGILRSGFTVINGIPVPSIAAGHARKLITQALQAYVNRLNFYLPLYSPIQAVRCSTTFQVYHSEYVDQYTIKGLVLEYQIEKEWLSFSALSDGTKRLFYILAELVSPATVSINKGSEELFVTDERKVILLEEPELGIHPHQLHKLLSLIREVSREHQVILTTHAPQVLDMLSEKELDRITICTLDPKKGTQFRKLSQAKRTQARAYMREELHLSDYWRYSYLEDDE